ncbi:berberine bridge enzyme-like 23 [Brachypodium distachyon]|uniref:FAD-binding PCMH-type domain-containing protein n=1 Tax=Brachypodium distachyon TaxID=15368 RepID=A0A0Q3FJ86_BRADI|nr:berberine bridge enzyme-like 23 [Brachypodium distachyon]KQJ98164.1 hypothetical protein BRADI_3g35231v3 [Brachypodium distachyon]|eukprot:XP_014756117.1 berberine bridge enzyme-like 23 [Brachypodium distachyon]
MRRSLALALFLSFFSCYLIISTPSLASSDEFLQCLRREIPSRLVYAQGSSNFNEVLASSIRNPKFFTNTTVRPLCIVTPAGASHVQAAVGCGRRWAVGLRVRSGGHDYEGLSYRSVRPMDFAVVDLAALRAVFVNHSDSTAWVDSGATIGELYYSIAKSSPETAFPAGVCPTMGVGGHFSGGGMGLMMRKHGLSVDNVVDAKLVNRDGAVLGRASMGEDLFWAVRGGGGSFGVVLSWKVRLVRVPPKVAVFNVARMVGQNATGILARWQDVAPALPGELTVRVLVQGRQRALFQALYLGTCKSLVATMGREFPELGMTGADCRPMTWLQSVGFAISGNADTPVEALLNRSTGALSSSSFVKNKSDYVRRAIPKAVWEDIFSRWFNKNIGSGGGRDGDGLMILGPHGGFMSTVPAAATPYPHRDGVLYNIQYIVSWRQQHAGDDGAAAMTWLGSLYDFMGQHVSKEPREAYVNYRDLDIGENSESVMGNANGVGGFDAGKAWGERYFMGNYRRLAQVKAAVDPTDYFRNEQSIPPLFQPRN